jgi:ATP-dependent DNA helicase RecQ
LTGCLQEYFGFEAFREGQFETIQNILGGKSTMFISETASGKSLTYIMSALVMKGFSLVISPLVSLMLDQL